MSGSSRWFAWVLVLLPGCALVQSLVVHPITVGGIEFDPSTLHTIGLSLPITGGDEDYDATVTVNYRQAGSSAWKEGLPLHRVRTKTLSRADPTKFPIAEQFAGSIFDLEPGVRYEIKLTVEDPDGTRVTRTGTVATRPVPSDASPSSQIVSVSDDEALGAALSNAKPGDVITLHEGRYRGPIRLENSGTASSPIVVKGAGWKNTAILAPGSDYGIVITGSHVRVEDLAVKQSAWGMKITDARDVVVRRTWIADVRYGINATGGANRDFYICDNVLEGHGVVWPDTSNRTWDYEGIVVTGTGHVICHNTLSGFGDALGLSTHTNIPNRAIDFYGNDVLWGGDDGVELDYSERNVRAYRNRFGNVAMGISFQPVWGGPVYAFGNVIYNTAFAPYKLNQDPSGFHIYHNTALRSGSAWTQYGVAASNFTFYNNLTMGTNQAVDWQPFIQYAQIDYNGWSPDGEFKFDYSWNGFASLRDDSPYEHHGRLLTQPVFEESIAIPANFAASMRPPSVTLHPRSNAVDAGIRLPNINDGYTGSAPDLGALERGREAPTYGVRWNLDVPVTRDPASRQARSRP
ncbi:MAG TPA: hypothetical protein VFS39_03380 [Nitrospira sp.]|nr:hypothetical protein [Nitrospira sp.]